MYVLLQTAAGFGLFEVLKQSKLKKLDKIPSYFESAQKAKQIINLVAFQKFKNSQQAVKAMDKTVAGKVSKSLKKLLKKNIIDKDVQNAIHIGEKKLATSIFSKLGIQCKHGELSNEIIRGIRSQLDSLLPVVNEGQLSSMTLGLSHSYSRYRLKMSSDKLDIMIIQAISLLQDLDKELNNYAMRLKEWYSWHFPQLVKIVGENLAFAKLVNAIGIRSNIDSLDLQQIVSSEDIEREIKQAARNSMGSDILEADQLKLRYLAQQVIEISNYRAELNTYLKNRMHAVAPSLTKLLGEQVGAKLISHAGSLMNLANHQTLNRMPASTVQILGAEKALFRAIKSQHNTPKYGIIYHASIVGNAPSKLKGKISRSLAAKASLCIRCDALGQDQEGDLGSKCNYYMEKKLNKLKEQDGQHNIRMGTSQQFKPVQFKQTAGYNPENDFVSDGVLTGTRKASSSENQEPKKKKKSKKVNNE